MIRQSTPYALSATVSLPYAEAVERAREELAEEGFGILSEIDIQATLQSKLGVDIGPYVILGACNPPLAHRALGAEIDIGTLLPCNVVVRAGAEAGVSIVSAMDPSAALSLSESEEIEPLAREVRDRLERVLSKIE